MKAHQPRPNDTARPYDGPAVMVVAAGDMDPLYRRLGPLPWTALVHLALNAAPTDNVWSAPIGVRDLAAGIGVTKDTAARAVRSLAAAGLVSRDRIATTGGPRRSGYPAQPAELDPSHPSST